MHACPVHVLCCRLVVSVCVISLGVVVAGYGEGHASPMGIFTMTVSITAEALRLVLMQYLMVSNSHSQCNSRANMHLLLYSHSSHCNNPNAGLLLLMLSTLLLLVTSVHWM
jgi:hypothetical protein